jgi:uncharacterized membrane protein YphA (DoxX/SURF4 family)
MSGSFRGTYRVVAAQVVGWLFVIAAFHKVLEPQGAIVAVAHIFDLSAASSLQLVTLIIIFEILLGSLLIPGVALRLASAGTLYCSAPLPAFLER